VARQPIATNSGDEPPVLLNKVRDGKGNFGYNAATGALGCIAATPAARAAPSLRSVAGLMVTAEAMVVEAPKKDSDNAGAGGGMDGMGGMDF
jgi:chaperonin GroEL